MKRKLVLWILVGTAGTGGCGLALGLGDFEDACPEVAEGKECPATSTSSGGLSCVPETSEPCYGGDPSTEGVGLCSAGSRTCSEAGSWGPCEGEVLPKDAEDCENDFDDDCNGSINDACAVCEPGAKQDCYSGPQGTQGVGLCHGGKRTCNPEGDGFGVCTGQVKPALEDCTAVGDEDCDGSGCSEVIFGHAYGDSEPQNPRYLASDAGGNWLVTGNFVGALDFGPGAPGLDQIGYDDVFLAKIAPDGAHVWSKNFGSATTTGIGAGIALDASGNHYLVGSYKGTLNFGGGVTLTSIAVAQTNAFVAKLDAAGAGLWAKDFGSVGIDSCNAVTVDKNGYAIVVGTQGSASGDSFTIRKYAAAGNQVWTKEPTMPSGSLLGNAIATDDATNVYVVGSFDTEFTFQGQIFSPVGGTDVLLMKLNSAGSLLWFKKFGNANNQMGTGIAVDSSGNVVIAGGYEGSINFGGTDFTSAGGMDIFVAKFGPSGNHIMSKRFGGNDDDFAFRMALDSKDHILLAGGFSGNINFGGGALMSAGGLDVFLVKLGPSGTHLWSKRFGDFANGQYGVGLATAPNDRIGLLVSAFGSMDFGNGAVQGGGGSDVFLASFQP